MEWKVFNKDNTSSTLLDRKALIDLLTAKVMEDDKEDFVALATTVSSILQGRNTLGQFTIDQLITTCIHLGYYYRVFLEKNNVEKIGETNELANTGGDESTSQDSSS